MDTARGCLHFRRLWSWAGVRRTIFSCCASPHQGHAGSQEERGTEVPKHHSIHIPAASAATASGSLETALSKTPHFATSRASASGVSDRVLTFFVQNPGTRRPISEWPTSTPESVAFPRRSLSVTMTARALSRPQTQLVLSLPETTSSIAGTKSERRVDVSIGTNYSGGRMFQSEAGCPYRKMSSDTD